VCAPSAGFREAGANVALTYQINRELSATFAITTTTFLSDARNSPLVRNPDSVNGLIGLSYRF
jgi:outer membrane scaffolding protein for murein synthesis (MipA/OmpV family)